MKTLSLILSLLVFGTLLSPAAGQEKSSIDRCEAETRALIRLLDEVLDVKEFGSVALSFGEALQLLRDKATSRGKELPILVNYDAFKKGKSMELLRGEVPMRLPPLPARMKVAGVLRVILAQFEEEDTTFLVRNGVVEILPARLATPHELLQQRVFA